MDNLHDLATTVGNAAAISVLCAMSAGLAAVSLLAGVARLKRNDLPEDYPGDAEALQTKYVLAFEQLNDARKENPNGLKNLIAGLRGQPGPALCLTAFDQFVSAHVDYDSTQNPAKKIQSPSTKPSAQGASPPGNRPGTGKDNPLRGKSASDADANPGRLKKPPNIKGPGGDQSK